MVIRILTYLTTIRTKQIMRQKRAYPKQAADQQTEGYNDKGNRHRNDKLQQWAVVSRQLPAIRKQETRQEEIMEQIDVQSTGTHKLQNRGKEYGAPSTIGSE